MLGRGVWRLPSAAAAQSLPVAAAAGQIARSARGHAVAAPRDRGRRSTAPNRSTGPCNNMASSPQHGLTCLSMHQPWASLLVHGIKRIEGQSAVAATMTLPRARHPPTPALPLRPAGRDWPTEYRGRLWIHATARVRGRRVLLQGAAPSRASALPPTRQPPARPALTAGARPRGGGAAGAVLPRGARPGWQLDHLPRRLPHQCAACRAPRCQLPALPALRPSRSPRCQPRRAAWGGSAAASRDPAAGG
jgi:hypothetical protein